MKKRVSISKITYYLGNDMAEPTEKELQEAVEWELYQSSRERVIKRIKEEEDV